MKKIALLQSYCYILLLNFPVDHWLDICINNVRVANFKEDPHATKTIFCKPLFYYVQLCMSYYRHNIIKETTNIKASTDCRNDLWVKGNITAIAHGQNLLHILPWLPSWTSKNSSWFQPVYVKWNCSSNEEIKESREKLICIINILFAFFS